MVFCLSHPLGSPHARNMRRSSKCVYIVRWQVGQVQPDAAGSHVPKQVAEEETQHRGGDTNNATLLHTDGPKSCPTLTNKCTLKATQHCTQSTGLTTTTCTTCFGLHAIPIKTIDTPVGTYYGQTGTRTPPPPRHLHIVRRQAARAPRILNAVATTGLDECFVKAKNYSR